MSEEKFVSEYDEHNEKVKERLDCVSDSFCLVKWKHSTINLAAGTVRNCCHSPSRPILGGEGKPLKFNDSAKDQAVRKALLAGQKPDACSYCWWVEQKGISHRIRWSGHAPLIEFYEEVAAERTNEVSDPSWVELIFSPLCNLKCAYCSPEHSTSWKAEIDEFGPYENPGHGDISYLDFHGISPYKEQREHLEEEFWIWFKKILPGLRRLTLTGGEPLINKSIERMYKFILEGQYPLLELGFHTNASIPSAHWKPFIEFSKKAIAENRVKDIFLYPSIEGSGQQSEYVRFGLKRDLFDKNIEDYLTQTSGKLVFNSSLSNLSISGLKKHWEMVYRLKQRFQGQWVSSTSELIETPKWMRVSILPKSFVRYVDEAIDFVEPRRGSEKSQISDHELHGLHVVRETLLRSESDKDLSKLRAQFWRFFSEYDRRRGVDRIQVFPEYAEFFDLCAKAAGEKISRKSFFGLRHGSLKSIAKAFQ